MESSRPISLDGWLRPRGCNRLVHEYEEIDPVKVFEALASAPADVVAYLRAIEAYLTQIEGSV